LSVCYVGKCAQAAGRGYSFKFNGGTVSFTNAQGKAWDSLGGSAPDPYVILTVDGVNICITGYFEDSTTLGAMDTNCSATLAASSEVLMEIWDYDSGATKGDKMDAVIYSGAALAQMLHAGGNYGFLNTNKLSTLDFTVTPE
jgi:hypothetical protein